ncbi:MAG: glycosyltransferase [Pirellulaceae bacterium]
MRKNKLLSFATSLNKDQFQLMICCIGNGPLAAELRALGIPVVTLGKETGQWGVKSLRQMQALCKSFHPDVIHCQGIPAGIRGHLMAKVEPCSRCNQDLPRSEPLEKGLVDSR